MSSTIVGAKVIIVGGGLAGLSAAHTVLERGGRVLVLDKKDFLGGNSVKATSGINGALTKAQIKLGIPDSAELFEEDTAISANLGVKAPPHPLATVLTHQSGPAVEWLIKQFGLDLSLVSRLGGHSQPRTHRGGERFPGMTITYALMEKMEEISSARPDVAQVIVAATATKLLKDADGSINGVEYVCNGQTFTEHGPVVIATGGFGADFGKDSLLAINRPDLLHLPTTNGDHCTGDGIKMSLAVGGSTIDMKSIQVHPTGLVLPSDPDAKVKWLAAEALRGVGGILLDGNGNRFCNELGTRDYVTGCMWKNKGPFRLVLNSAGVKEIEWHCKHYVGRGLMKKFNHGKDLAKEIGCSEATLAKTINEYNGFAKNNNDPFGKKYFQNLPFDINDTNFHVAIVTPVVHYCMGGIQIDTDANIIKEDGKTKLQGLFAAGECAGGVHGKNRLGGSGLLGCVVYGRVAGESASRYLLQQLSTGAGASGNSGPAGINIHITFDGKNVSVAGNKPNTAAAAAPVKKTDLAAVAASAEGGAAPAGAKKAAPAGSDKTYTLEEVAKHATDKDCWVVVNGAVLNATSFLDKHPGGKESIMLYAGKDASAEFNMLHKPDVIVKYAPHIIIGKLADSKKAKL